MNQNKFQKMLYITNNTSKKYHTEYEEAESNVMTISIKEGKPVVRPGNMELKHANIKATDNIRNSMKGPNPNQIQTIRGKTEAVYQRILALARNTVIVKLYYNILM